MPFSRCHLCGRALVVHRWFVANGYQHEEYYCDGCGELSQTMFPMRLSDPLWREAYERRQRLLEQGPGGHGRNRKSRHKARDIKKWADEVYALGQELVADRAPEEA